MKNAIIRLAIIRLGLVLAMLLPTFFVARSEIKGTELAVFNRNCQDANADASYNEMRMRIVNLVTNTIHHQINKKYKAEHKNFKWYIDTLIYEAKIQDMLNRDLYNPLKKRSEETKRNDYSGVRRDFGKAYYDNGTEGEGSLTKSLIDKAQASGHVIRVDGDYKKIYNEGWQIFSRTNWVNTKRQIEMYAENPEELMDVLNQGMVTLEKADKLTRYINASTNVQKADSAYQVSLQNFNQVNAEYQAASNNGQNRNLVPTELHNRMSQASADRKQKKEELAIAAASQQREGAGLTQEEQSDPEGAKNDVLGDLAALTQIMKKKCPNGCVKTDE